MEELYGTRYQSGSFSLNNVGSGFHRLSSFPPLFSWNLVPGSALNAMETSSGQQEDFPGQDHDVILLICTGSFLFTASQ